MELSERKEPMRQAPDCSSLGRVVSPQGKKSCHSEMIRGEKGICGMSSITEPAEHSSDAVRVGSCLQLPSQECSPQEDTMESVETEESLCVQESRKNQDN